MSTFVLLLAVLVASVGTALLWANPHRFTNQVFALIAAVGTFRLFFIFMAMEAGLRFAVNHYTSPVPWIKANAAITAFVPWLIWLLRESILKPKSNIRDILLRSSGWLIAGAAIALISLTDAYIPSDSTPDNERRGYLYPWVTAIMIPIYLYLGVETWLSMKQTKGVQRIEMQFISFNISVAALLTIMLMALGNLLDLQILRRINLLATVGASIITAWAVTYYRVFDMRQVFIPLARHGTLIVLLYATVASLLAVLESVISAPFNLIIVIGLAGVLVLALEYMSRDISDIQGRKALSRVRISVLDIARVESRRDKLLLGFESLLRNELHCSMATLLTDDGGRLALPALSFSKENPLHQELSELSWITPESVDRRKKRHPSSYLKEFLAQHRLGAVVAVPRGSQMPSLIIALGQKTNEWPFTFPEIERLLNVAELMDNILTHARLAAQAALNAKVEFLAMMSRGLAHDLRNLITPIATFLVHTEGQCAEGTAEAEVHAAARRSVRSMDDYIREALLFSEQLALKLTLVDLRTTFETVRQVCTNRAAARGVIILFRCEHKPITADAVLLQRLLTNLVNNAIDASREGQSVALSTAPGRPGWVRLEVGDHGCGIPADHRERIFEPYFTTKQYGRDVRGFGLGLTICKKIADLHGGVIAVSSEVGVGTTFSVDLPVKPEAS